MIPQPAPFHLNINSGVDIFLHLVIFSRKLRRLGWVNWCQTQGRPFLSCSIYNAGWIIISNKCLHICRYFFIKKNLSVTAWRSKQWTLMDAVSGLSRLSLTRTEVTQTIIKIVMHLFSNNSYFTFHTFVFQFKLRSQVHSSLPPQPPPPHSPFPFTSSFFLKFSSFLSFKIASPRPQLSCDWAWRHDSRCDCWRFQQTAFRLFAELLWI